MLKALSLMSWQAGFCVFKRSLNDGFFIPERFILSPFVASLIISAMGGYRSLFIAALVLVVIGALCVRPIRSVH